MNQRWNHDLLRFRPNLLALSLLRRGQILRVFVGADRNPARSTPQTL
jgi:hypothetical protein